jgi:hypothetical protein
MLKTILATMAMLIASCAANANQINGYFAVFPIAEFDKAAQTIEFYPGMVSPSTGLTPNLGLFSAGGDAAGISRSYRVNAQENEQTYVATGYCAHQNLSSQNDF